jgi:hypothetical protein
VLAALFALAVLASLFALTAVLAALLLLTAVLAVLFALTAVLAIVFCFFAGAATIPLPWVPWVPCELRGRSFTWDSCELRS